MSTMKNHTILIVDDNRISKRITSAFLSSLGASTKDASDGNEAIEKAQDTSITAVFMNLMLPRMSGIEATKLIRKSNKEIPIYAITSDYMEKMTNEMKKAGFTNVISKPFDKETVVTLLSSVQQSLPVFDEKLYTQTFQDPELQKDIIDTFLNEEETDTKRLLDAFKTKDKDEIYAAVHYMKGSFTYLKASKILETTQSILDQLKQDNVDYALEHKEEFMELYYELVNVLKNL